MLEVIYGSLGVILGILMMIVFHTLFSVTYFSCSSAVFELIAFIFVGTLIAAALGNLVLIAIPILGVVYFIKKRKS